METAYFMYREGRMHIPIGEGGSTLFDRLKQTNIGRWDGERRQFVLAADYVHRAVLARFFSDLTLICVDDDAEQSVIKAILWAEPWGTPCYVPKQQPIRAAFSQKWRDKLTDELKARKYSPKTINSYVFYNRELCCHAGKTPERMQSADLKNYLAYLNDKKHASAATMNMVISAVRFFYRNIMETKALDERKRPRNDKRLPVVLSRLEIRSMLENEKNEKHRLLLTMVYASGFRVSEVVSLKRSDIDLARKTIRVCQGKGRKDRYTILADSVIADLKKYYASHGITEWVFPGMPPDKPLSIRSAQHICEHALERAGIEKDASIHSLRHTFATHLLEDGTDIKYIKELLGHASIKTTERYIHVARRKTLKIPSPFDKLNDPD